MNGDMRLLREFGEELKPLTDQPPADLRRRVLAGAVPAGSPRRARSWSRPRLLRLVSAAATVTAVLGGLLVVADARLSGPTPGGVAARSPGQVLELAAEQVATSRTTDPQADQFILTESVVVRQEIIAQGWRLQSNPTMVVQRWQSVDGSRDGLIRERPADAAGATWRIDRIASCGDCRPDLPIDGASMYRFLYDPATEGIQAIDGGADDLAIERVTFVLSSGQASPAVQEALFTALQRIPRVTTRARAVDVTGRKGIGLVYTGNGGETELVFDATSYRYLGMNRKLSSSYFEVGRDMSVVVREAIQRIAVVDRVGALD